MMQQTKPAAHWNKLVELAAESSVLTVHPSESVCKNAQPQNSFLRFTQGLGEAPLTSGVQKCIDICIACRYYTEFMKKSLAWQGLVL